MGRKRVGSPQIPLAIRKEIGGTDDEMIEKRFVSTGPGKTGLSRKLLRKRHRAEKKQRRNAFHSKNPYTEPPKITEKSLKPPKKKQKVERSTETKNKQQKQKKKPDPPKPIKPILSREDEDIQFYEKKLRRYHMKKDQVDGM